MSLLMEALKKAEQAKKQSPSDKEEKATESLPESLSLAPSDFPTVDPDMVLEDEPVPEPHFSAPSKNQSDQAGHVDMALIEPQFEQVVAPEPKHVEPTLSEPTQKIAEPAEANFLPPENSINTPVDAVTAKAQSTPPRPDRTLNIGNDQKTSQNMAQTILEAKRPVSGNRALVITCTGLILVMLCSIGGLFYLQKVTQYADLSQAQQPVFNPMSAPPVLDAADVPTKPLADQPITPPRSTASNQDTLVDPSTNLRNRERSSENFAADQIHIQKANVLPAVNADLLSAYQLFSKGDTNAAKPLYEKVLRNDANNRDALLGLAAIALDQDQSDRAATIYTKLLYINSSDPDAIAGMASIKKSDPEQSESQLKKVLAQNPQSGSTLFELGNLYMAQSRWSEAQDVYFRAFGASPQNADYAFNLAISLDRLGQNKLALEYYQRAVTLAKDSNSKFSQEAAQNRIDQLQAVTQQPD